MATANICAICQESLANNKVTLTTVCQHVFHFECITKNVKVNNNKCPLCRKPIECFSGAFSAAVDIHDNNEGRWNCRYRTYANSRNVDICAICNQDIRPQGQSNNPRHHTIRPIVSQSRSPSTTLKPQPKSKSKSKTAFSSNNQLQWACSACTCYNSDSAQKCIICQQGCRPEQNVKSIKSTIIQPVVQTSHLAGNTDASQTFVQIAEKLRSNVAYRDLNLSSQKITLNEMQMIAEGLKYNTTVTHLFIINNNLSDDHAKLIAEALKFNKTLISLSMDWNNISDVGGMAIANALTVNRTLNSLHMTNNKLSSIVKTMIDKTGKNHRNGSYWRAAL